jgi:hypothetical protein
MEDVVWGVLIFMMVFGIVIVHEIGHAWVAVKRGLKLKFICLGLPVDIEWPWKIERDFHFWPISINSKTNRMTMYMWKYEKDGLVIGITPLLTGGAVDFYDYDKTSYLTKVLVLIAGPFTHVLMALLPLMWFGGFFVGLDLFNMAVIEVFGAYMGIGNDFSIDKLSSLSEFVIASQDAIQTWGWWSYFIIVNISMLVLNLFIPYPIFDGGQIILETINVVFKGKTAMFFEILSKVSFWGLLTVYLLLLVVLEFR